MMSALGGGGGIQKGDKGNGRGPKVPKILQTSCPLKKNIKAVAVGYRERKRNEDSF